MKLNSSYKEGDSLLESGDKPVLIINPSEVRHLPSYREAAKSEIELIKKIFPNDQQSPRYFSDGSYQVPNFGASMRLSNKGDRYFSERITTDDLCKMLNQHLNPITLNELIILVDSGQYPDKWYDLNNESRVRIAVVYRDKLKKIMEMSNGRRMLNEDK
jgi:hypothetical protein